MPNRDPSAVLPSSGWVNLVDLDRMASAAADRAVAGVALKQGDVEKIVEEGVQEGLKRFMERVGIDDIPAFRKDLTALRAARETREALVSHGLKAVVTVLAGGICTAIWLAIKGAK